MSMETITIPTSKQPEERLVTRHFKCDGCKNKTHYTTGRDEYPGLTTIQCCSKGHWDGINPEPKLNQDFSVWDDCKDFQSNNRQ